MKKRTKTILIFAIMLILGNLLASIVTAEECTSKILNVNKSIFFEEKKITLIDVSSSSIVIDVDGTSKVVSKEEDIVIKGIIINLKDVNVNKEKRIESSAIVCLKKEKDEEKIQDKPKGSLQERIEKLEKQVMILKRSLEKCGCNKDLEMVTELKPLSPQIIEDKEKVTELKPLSTKIKPIQKRPSFFNRLFTGRFFSIWE